MASNGVGNSVKEIVGATDSRLTPEHKAFLFNLLNSEGLNVPVKFSEIISEIKQILRQEVEQAQQEAAKK